MRVVAGFDWSLSCPGLCIHLGDTWSPDQCYFYYMYGVKKWLRNQSHICSEIQPKFLTDEARIEWMTEWYMSFLRPYKVEDITVCIENYSYTSKSSSTHIIAESTGVLKNKLFKEGFPPIQKYAVPSVKKFGSGKGNATKIMMYKAFLKEGSWLPDVLPCPEGLSPLSDLIDAYYVAKMGFFQIK